MAWRFLALQDCHFLPGGRVSVRTVNGAVVAALWVLAVRSQQIHGLVDGDARRHRSGGTCGCFGLAAMPFFLLDTKTFICLSILIQAAHGAVGRCLDHLAGMLRYEKETPIALRLNGKMFPASVGVVCGLPRAPRGHIGKNPVIFVSFFGEKHGF